MCGGATQPKGSLCCDRLDIGDSANAIRSKNLSVVAHAANITSRCDIRKLETRAGERFPKNRNLIGLRIWATFWMKSASPGMIYFVRCFAARACSRTFRPCAFNSFSLRCKVRRLIPSCVAAAVMFPPVELSAWVISRFSVSAKSSGFAVSETVIAPPDVPTASRSHAANRVP